MLAGPTFHQLKETCLGMCRIPVSGKIWTSGNIWVKFAGYLPDSTVTYFIATIKRKSLPQLKNYENTNMFFVVKYCIKHVGLAKNVVSVFNK